MKNFLRKYLLTAALMFFAAMLPACNASSRVSSSEELSKQLHILANSFDGRVGICVQDSSSTISVNGEQHFSLQSVMKLIVAAAVMDALHRRNWHLSDPILVRKQDLSLNIQPLAELVKNKGCLTTLDDLIFRAVVDSDSAASDILFARIGGAAEINAFLERSRVRGIRVDRDERHLQTETVGLTWRPEYVDASILDHEKKMVSKERQEIAFQTYLKDVRDTATPKGMTSFLYRLATGKILSPTSTQYILEVMRQTITFPDRLKAGVPAGWRLAHKTGTSATWNGVNGTTNDVGVLTAPDNKIIAVSVFIGESKRSAKERAELIAEVAHIITVAHEAR